MTGPNAIEGVLRVHHGEQIADSLTGVTNNLERRVYEHKNKLVHGFTTRYNIKRLVFFEATDDVLSATAREKEIKGWTRAKKVALIEASNPTWVDLSAQWEGE
ncbi:MAG TPA: GIY-YIG nuclease family protein [Anaerolineales bacterium]|nr:GIY-YIG nuclease family protein [Anaerolineales bacterium]